MYFAKNEIILEPYEDIAIKKENDSQYTKMATSYKGENLYINEEPVFLLRKSYKEPDMPEFANIETRKVSVQEELNPVLIKLEQLLLKQKLYSLSRFYQQFSILKTHIYGYSCDKAVKCGHEDGYLHLVLANDEDPKTVYHYYQNQGLILHENRFFPADPGILINEEDVKNFPLMKKHAKNEILLPTNLKKRF
uniref:hypothetical protein n=1 Tax=Candidatus Ventrenecus sp. TaxID=3085654 RepID=UPI004028BDEA